MFILFLVYADMINLCKRAIEELISIELVLRDEVHNARYIKPLHLTAVFQRRLTHPFVFFTIHFV